jgi:hypothetical protein
MGDDAPLSSAEPPNGLREDVQAILGGAVLLRELVGWGHRGQTYPSEMATLLIEDSLSP